VVTRIGGAVTVTTKGISTILNLTLGKPAAIFDMVAGKGKLCFEPQFRFALEGKPWCLLKQSRYKVPGTRKEVQNWLVDDSLKKIDLF
jgi:hypothetical protein